MTRRLDLWGGQSWLQAGFPAGLDALESASAGKNCPPHKAGTHRGSRGPASEGHVRSSRPAYSRLLNRANMPQSQTVRIRSVIAVAALVSATLSAQVPVTDIRNTAIP